MPFYKLTDDQKDLLLAMIEDINQLDDETNDSTMNALMKVYNDGGYMGGTKLYLNGVRDWWLKRIYNEGNSCWHDLRETIKL
jgi:hypothetical protein